MYWNTQCDNVLFRVLHHTFNPLSRISHLSGSHASLTHAIAYNPIAKELIKSLNIILLTISSHPKKPVRHKPGLKMAK